MRADTHLFQPGRPAPSHYRPGGLTVCSLPLTSRTASSTQFLRKHPDPRRNTVALVATAVIATGLIAGTGKAVEQDSHLPDIGSSAGEVLGPAKQREYGEMALAQMRNYGYTLEDPLLSGWLQGVGDRLGAASDKPDQAYTLFLLKDRQINAFATLGGYIAVNAGLVLAANREDEVAAVLSHEIAHVTQSHVLRAVERAQRDSVPILLAMLGAIALSQASHSNSGDNAAMAAMASAQGLLVQRQIDYTRDNEAQADRIGIRTLARSGYDPAAMANFFEKLQSIVRANQGTERERTPDYLQTHPVTTSRISESRERARQIAAQPKGFLARADRPADNPLLPGSLRIGSV